MNTTATTIHTCSCRTCAFAGNGGLSFVAPEGYIHGTPQQVKEMIHNHAHLTRDSLAVVHLAAQGVRAVVTDSGDPDGLLWTLDDDAR